MISDLGLLILRLATGTLVAGHGSQKLFGWFGGYGVPGTAGWLESMGLRPGRIWAFLAGLSEFGSGVLTSLGLFHPVGPILMMSPMIMALTKVHWDKPIWVTEGGGELPVTNMAVATSLAMNDPGRFSLDRLFGIRVPWQVVGLVMLGTAAGVAAGLSSEPAPTEQTEEVSGGKLQAGTDAATVGRPS